jgi:hypothetical protein
MKVVMLIVENKSFMLSAIRLSLWRHTIGHSQAKPYHKYSTWLAEDKDNNNKLILPHCG